MKITRISTTLLRAPGFRPIQDATMPPPRSAEGPRTSLFVHIHTDAGLQGLGFGSAATAVRAVIEDSLKDLLIGEDPFDIERHWENMFWRVRGFGRKGIAFCGISALDCALWDLKAKALGQPLFKLLGPYRDRVPVYGSGGWTNFDEKELLEEQAGYVERGFRSVKMKVGKDFGKAEREDVRRLAAVRKAVGDDVEVLIDANNGYYAKQAIGMAREFEQYRVGWFEEPVLADDIEGLAAVARATPIPIATGEHEYTKFGFKDLIARGGADVVQPDLGRVGGVTEWLKVAHLAHAFNLPIAPHAYALPSLHLACATPNLRIVEYLGVEEQGYKVFLTDVPEPKDGIWAPFPDRPGLGVELNPYAVEKYSV